MAYIMWQSSVENKDEDWMFQPPLQLRKQGEYMLWLLQYLLHSDNSNSSRAGQLGWGARVNIPLCYWQKHSLKEKLFCNSPWLQLHQESSSNWPEIILMWLPHNWSMFFLEINNSKKRITLKESPTKIWTQELRMKIY